MKKLIAVAAVAAALTLAGCSAAPAGNDAAVKSAKTSSSAPQLTAAPTSDEQDFYNGLKNITGLPPTSNAEAIKVGHSVCDQLDAGSSPLKITPVKGGTDEANWGFITLSALTLCKSHNDAVQNAFKLEAQRRSAASN